MRRKQPWQPQGGIIGLALLAAALAFTLVMARLYNTQDAVIFPRTVGEARAPNPKGAAFEKLTLATPDGEQLSGVAFPAAHASGTLVLAFAGNAHDVVGFASFLKNDVFGRQPQVGVAGLAYRGYPNGLGASSTGTPTEAGLKADAVQMYDVLKARARASKVYAVGYSLGSAVATYLATQRKLDGLVLVAPPASIRRLAEEKYPYLPVGPLVKYPWATEDIIGTVSTTVTLIYTPTDGLIPETHAHILQQALPGMRLVRLEGVRHGTILEHRDMPEQLRKALAAGDQTP